MKRILIVEDNPLEASQIESLLLTIDEDLEIHITGSAEQALELASKDSIDVFLLDYQLEDYDGFMLAEKLRAQEKYVLAPIVFITGVKDRELIGYRNYHCYEYIIKPYSKDEFVETMGRLINNTRQAEETLLLKQRIITQVIRVKYIRYVEYKNRKIYFHTDNDVLNVTNKTLTDIEDMAKRSLVRIHQSFLVNKNRITKIDHKNKCIYIEGTRNPIPVGRSYGEKLRELSNDIS